MIASLIGVVFMVAYPATRALPPIMLAHFTINFTDFSGVIPKTLFEFTRAAPDHGQTLIGDEEPYGNFSKID